MRFFNDADGIKLIMQAFLTVIGAVVVAYLGVRIFATGVDIFQRWRTGNWDM